MKQLINASVAFILVFVSVSVAGPKTVVDLVARHQAKSLSSELRNDVIASQAWDGSEESLLRVTGRGLGWLRTGDVFDNYHMVLEYKRGEHTWSDRADSARNFGVFVHGTIADGEISNAVRVNVTEGKAGEVRIIDTGVPTRPIPGSNADPNWQDIKGHYFDGDVENPVGEWNRLEIVCRADAVTVHLNGKRVNSIADAPSNQGDLGIVSHGSEVFIRQWKLYPLDTFKDAWQPEVASRDTGYSETGESILPRRHPFTPAQSLAAWEIDGPYEIQLVAAEPLVCDPVDVVWDAAGRMYVAELRDYPLPPGTGPRLSRIRLLEDTDHDGVMDKATTWADQLDDVQGMLPMNDGLLITSRTGIHFFKDSNADNVADIFQPLYVVNEPRHNQLQISSPRWDIDNTITFNNGIDSKQIHPVDKPDQKLSFTRMNLRLDPQTNALMPLAGMGQFGTTYDDWGRRFYCTNRSPAIFNVLPRDVLTRNQYAGLTSGQEDIQPAASRVWPIQLSHTTSIAHAGTHTAACGSMVYRGGLMPDINGDMFVCDPTAQLVTRNRMVANGTSFKAERVGDNRDFLVSRDEWCRPVNLRNGPDGALYICDMVRRFIDHSRFFPDAFSQTNYMRAGFDHGRIWRLVPKGQPVKGTVPLAKATAGLVNELQSPHAWRRIHAQRILVERRDLSAVGDLEKLLSSAELPQARLHAFRTLQGLGKLDTKHIQTALRDDTAQVVENAIGFAAKNGDVTELMNHPSARVRSLALMHSPGFADSDKMASLLQRTPDDPWLRDLVMATSESAAGDTLVKLLQLPIKHPAVIQDLAVPVGARGDVREIGRLISLIPGRLEDWEIAFTIGLGDGLRRSKLATKSVAALVKAPPKGLSADLAGIRRIFESASATALDRKRSPAQRLAAIDLAKQQGEATILPLVERLIHPAESPDIQRAACQALRRVNRDKVADFFFERWSSLSPIVLSEAVQLIATNSRTAVRLMEKMKAGEIAKSLMPPMQRWVYGRSRDPKIKGLVDELFGRTDADRAKVIAKYKAAISQLRGDADRGKQIFVKASCATCHRIGDVGVDVGPSLADVRIKPAEALLSDILDPNRALEERWTTYTVETSDGQIRAGIIASDTADTIQIKLPGGVTQSIDRSAIVKLTSSGLSLMPVGLEQSLGDAQAMADLIAYLKAR